MVAGEVVDGAAWPAEQVVLGEQVINVSGETEASG